MNSYEILKKAQKNKYAIGSFNFSTAEILKAIVLTAAELKSPVIVSTSEGEADFMGMREAAALVKAWRVGTKMPIMLNLDHGKSLKSVKKALAAGYDMVHFDGSELSYEKNVAETKKAVDFARDFEKTFDKKIIIEGELGYLRGSSSLHSETLEIKPEDLTSPDQAKDFVAKTGVDSLAIVIGNAHGVYIKSKEKLDLERLERIKEAVEDKAFLVLHGGSGIPPEDIRLAVQTGVVKVNINTEIRVAYMKALEESLLKKPYETTPYKVLRPGFEAAKEIAEEKIKLFGSDNKI